jgi:hypothetical protein
MSFSRGFLQMTVAIRGCVLLNLSMRHSTNLDETNKQGLPGSIAVVSRSKLLRLAQTEASPAGEDVGIISIAISNT